MNEDSTGGGPSVPGSQWYDADAGPLVRPYAMTGGRTKPGPSNVRFDLIALGVVDDDPPGPAEESLLGPEHRSLLALCRAETQSVAGRDAAGPPARGGRGGGAGSAHKQSGGRGVRRPPPPPPPPPP
ncbi:DUF742 domain-containing protein, partial [Streptomyces sp. NPDC059810]|uniref:DUF742 domain-containing protein n=1 Tax=Streptomyces sp. NPDC059810 TaxID=3346956 RepID=UPI003646B21D